ncbi:MAG TPA: hypothetical protein PKJ98_20805 [Verrucomicrobiota bacterium]|nr:hypothetical protein [Verrucomicrobiota bacterium]
MKTHLKTLFLSILAAFAVAGCSTLTPAEKIDQAAKVANLAAFVGAGLHLADNPEDRAYFVASVTALEALADSDNYTPSSLAAALRELPIRELRGSKGTIYLTAGVSLWDEASRQILRVDTSGAAKVFAEAIRKGLAEALATTPQSL